MVIRYKRGKCNGVCGKEDVLLVNVSLKLCAVCNRIRLMKRYAERRKEKIRSNVKADKNKLVPFYKEVWDRNEHVCYETGERLYSYNKFLVHHVLHKEDYPELAFNHDVCVLLSLEQHSNWHTMAKSDRARLMPRTWNKYLELCKQYKLKP